MQLLRESKEFKIYLIEAIDEKTKHLGINVTIDRKLQYIVFNIFNIKSEIL
jgi:hypothetical protein